MSQKAEERLPTQSEIADKSPDGVCAIKHFYGKSLKKAQQLFVNGGISLCGEDFLWMNPIGFRFYIRAAINFCLSPRADGDSDLVSSLAGILSLWHEQHPHELDSCSRFLAGFCTSVVAQFDRFDADPAIYVGLREQYEQLADTFGRLADASGN